MTRWFIMVVHSFILVSSIKVRANPKHASATMQTTRQRKLGPRHNKQLLILARFHEKSKCTRAYLDMIELCQSKVAQFQQMQRLVVLHSVDRVGLVRKQEVLGLYRERARERRGNLMQQQPVMRRKNKSHGGL
jgi:hypothetical protein